MTLHGYGHYHETYEKIDGRWRIKTSKLTRLREDVTMPIFTPRIAARLRATAAKIARRSADYSVESRPSRSLSDRWLPCSLRCGARLQQA